MVETLFKNKMTKLELIEFENKEKFNLAIEKVLSKENVFREYKDKDGQTQKKKIIGNNRLYLGNNMTLNIVEADNKKVYLSIDYFSVDDRINIAKNKDNNL